MFQQLTTRFGRHLPFFGFLEQRISWICLWIITLMLRDIFETIITLFGTKKTHRWTNIDVEVYRYFHSLLFHIVAFTCVTRPQSISIPFHHSLSQRDSNFPSIFPKNQNPLSKGSGSSISTLLSSPFLTISTATRGSQLAASPTIASRYTAHRELDFKKFISEIQRHEILIHPPQTTRVQRKAVMLGLLGFAVNPGHMLPRTRYPNLVGGSSLEIHVCTFKKSGLFVSSCFLFDCLRICSSSNQSISSKM